jgi:DNA-binding MarR family transcriptional regulator/N-acetylglutamate synthase-like GNAT family acetyltransferase
VKRGEISCGGVTTEELVDFVNHICLYCIMKSQVKQIRYFNRFYTSHLGILNNHFLESDYSLSEVRVLYEIGEHPTITAQELCELLSIDKGYLSRILKLFKKGGIIISALSKKDARVYEIGLTAKGSKLLASLQQKSDQQIEKFISKLNPDESGMLVNSMRTIETLLAAGYNNQFLAKQVSYREGLKPGDIGYLIYLHGVLYAKESGYSQEFERYVVKTFYDFLEHYTPEKDKIWLATYNGQIVGCISILNRPDQEAQLRWFLVQPVFRGTGIGKHLLETALSYCVQQSYKKVYLFTTDIQQRAIGMYRKAGFQSVTSVTVNQWGKVLQEERYDLELS